MFPEALKDIFYSKPAAISQEAENLWRDLGPIDLALVYHKCTDDIKIDFDLQIGSGVTQKGNIYEG